MPLISDQSKLLCLMISSVGDTISTGHKNLLKKQKHFFFILRSGDF